MLVVPRRRRKGTPIENTPTINVTSIIVLVSVSVSSSTIVNAKHHKTKCTQLWVFTFPVQKDGCVVMRHGSTVKYNAFPSKEAMSFGRQRNELDLGFL
jgi:hypothetical protein